MPHDAYKEDPIPVVRMHIGVRVYSQNWIVETKKKGQKETRLLCIFHSYMPGGDIYMIIV